MSDAFNNIIQNRGIASEKSYSYQGSDGICRSSAIPVARIRSFQTGSCITQVEYTTGLVGPAQIMRLRLLDMGQARTGLSTGWQRTLGVKLGEKMVTLGSVETWLGLKGCVV
ncbi:hypothetical protein F2Q69_00001607 [Brassica cretica]|uniref:Uncharacterized protein n=1 Tax=Brassica cretica TaxID=69181 RepID=A0A8S9PAK6_BRACR|nr:hypothetical protein F2Q69_00001607 [Brassica cretica]